MVPTLFDALAQGKPLPSFESAGGYTTIDKPGPGAPISFVPDDVMHSFALAFDVRTSAHGRLATVHGNKGAITIDLDGEGKIKCASTSGAVVSSDETLHDGKWHQFGVSYQYLSGRTEFFLDGVSIGQGSAKFAPTQFILGGDRKSSQASASGDYRRFLVYRAPLNADDVKALQGGVSIQASLEVFAPLSAEQLEAGKVLTNVAQSTSQLLAYPTQDAEATAHLAKKIDAATKNRRVIDPDEKMPLELSPSILESYVGVYEIGRGQMGSGMKLIITLDEGRLLFSPDGQGRTQLYAESENEFFMRIFIRAAGPKFKMGISFLKGKKGKIDELIFHQGSTNMKAKRIAKR